MFQWLWTGEPGLILILTCSIPGLLHTAHVISAPAPDGAVYVDVIDADKSANKQAIVSRDVMRAISFEELHRHIPVCEWIKNRKREVLWAHYHNGSRLSATWTTIRLIAITLAFWKTWAKASWLEYFALLCRGAPAFIKLLRG